MDNYINANMIANYDTGSIPSEKVSTLTTESGAFAVVNQHGEPAKGTPGTKFAVYWDADQKAMVVFEGNRKERRAAMKEKFK